MFIKSMGVSVMSLVLSLSSFCYAATYGGGSGGLNDPYQIWTADQMNTIGANAGDWDKHFKLMANIDMSAYSGVKYRIIGNGTTPFTGSFDGNGHKLSNLNYKTTNYVDYVGVFGNISNATIQNLAVENVLISSGGQYIGGIVGQNLGTVISCSVTGSVTGYYYVGGLVGQNCGSMTDCYSTASSNGTDYIGGLTGYNKSGAISACYATGAISGMRCIGGLVGGALNGTVQSSYASGKVDGYRNVGGLMGYNLNGLITACYATGATKGTAESFTRVGGLLGANDGTVTACYATGAVVGSAQAGGVAGVNLYGTITASFWDVQASARSVGIGGGILTGAAGLGTAAMKTFSTYSNAGWDFTDTDGDAADWRMPNQDYPRLAWEPYGGGKGTPEHPYQIWTAEQMNTVGTNPGDWGKHFKLMADINMSVYPGTQYRIIGTDAMPFTGTFNGNGHVIHNLTYTTASAVDYVGLFGNTKSATIYDLALENALVSSGGQYVGGLAGQNAGSIRNCTVTGSISGYYYVGGLAGQNVGSMTNCSSASLANGTDYIGGLVGYNKSGMITACHATGAITGTRCVGGLAGGCYYGSITSSYATGAILGFRNIGGLVGYNLYGAISTCYAMGSAKGTADSYTRVGGLIGGNDGAVTGCYATGVVTGPAQAGGLVGTNESGSLAVCFWDTQTSGKSNGVGEGTFSSVTGLATAAMKTLASFVAAGWDFTDTDGDAADWRLPNNDYPRLVWEPYNEGNGGYGGGSGTVEDPYQIWTPEQMNTIGANSVDWNKHFTLMANLDMSAYTGTQYHIIGNSTLAFSGSFDGNGHTISNLIYTTSSAVDYVGLFGCTRAATIKNLGVKNVSLSTGGQYVGGLAGLHWGGTLTACYTTGQISGTTYVGGLAGYNKAGTLTACYANDSVRGTTYVGGLVGGTDGAIAASYAVGAVSGTSRVGGLAGTNLTGSFTTCFWNTQTSGRSNAVGEGTSSGVKGLGTEAMMTLSTFTAVKWDFINTWGIGNGQTYPYLKPVTGINPADIDYNGAVDMDDLSIVQSNWLKQQETVKAVE